MRMGISLSRCAVDIGPVAGLRWAMRLTLLINRAAGGFRRLPLDATVAAIAMRLRAGGHQVAVQLADPGDLSAAMRELAAAEGSDPVVIGGGDGTLLSAIHAGLGVTRPLGLLPLGTMNLFARDLGLPRDPIEAAGLLAGAQPAEIDLAEVNGIPFAIWASLGMHPKMVRRRDHLQRDGMGKWRAMALAALRVLRRYPMIKARLTIHGETIVFSTPLVVVTNNAWRREQLPPSRQALDGGVLEVHVARCRSRLALVWLAINALLGRWSVSRLLESHRAESVQLLSHKHRVMVSLDGEVTVMRPPLAFKARPKALRVLMP